MGYAEPAEVVFRGRAPDFARIAESIEATCGLSASVQELAPDLNSYDMHARLAFTCAPEEGLELYSYRPPRAIVHYNEALTLTAEAPPQPECGESLSDSEGHQVLYLESHRDREPTLYYVSLLALESIGGRVLRPISEERRMKYRAPLTEAELVRRRRKARLKLRLSQGVTVLLLPVILPLLFLYLLWIATWIPFEWRRIRRLARETRTNQIDV